MCYRGSPEFETRGADRCLDRIKAAMRGDVLVDLRNIYLPAQAQAVGFAYIGLGREDQRLTVSPHFGSQSHLSEHEPSGEAVEVRP